jgi:DNA-binding transcriptional LysR family regulator
VKALLAVARSGSTAGAARALKVNQTTVARRIEALERDFGVRLVERTQTGATLTEAGLCLVADSEIMERAALGMGQKIAAHRRGVSGALRVTLSEMLAANVITPLLPEFREAYPDVTLEMVISDQRLDLEAGEADIALRISRGPLPDSNLVARKVNTTEWALYCSRDYANRMGRPATPADLGGHLIVGGTHQPQTTPGLQRILDQAPDVTATLRSTSLGNQFDSVRAGLGLGVMPCVRADGEADLVQVFPPDPMSVTHTWIVTRPELKDAPRVRAFVDFFAKRVVRWW